MIMPKGQQLLLPVNPVFIAASLVAALALNMLPLGRVVWTPDWVMVLLVFWGIHQPQRVGLGVAFLMGLCIDVYQSALLGQHALAYTALSFLAITIHRRMLRFPVPLQAVQVLPLFVACTSTLLLSRAFWRTPVVAFMPDITPSPFRSQANGIINFMGGVGSIVATLGGSRLYAMNEAYPFWLGSALVIIAVLLLFAFVREPKEYEATSSERPSMWHALQD